MGGVARGEQNASFFKALEVGGVGELYAERPTVTEKGVHKSPNPTFISPKKTYRWPKSP